jgi:hypothetical protein
MEDGFTPLPDSLLTQAFMRRIEDGLPRRASVRAPSSRRLSQKAALTADLLHSFLTKQGVREPRQLAWVTGVEGSQISTELSEDVLDALRGLLAATSDEEGKLRSTDSDAALVPAEAFLQSLLKEAGPLKTLSHRVELTLQMVRFPAQASALEMELHSGLVTARAILKSSTIPILLEGVLLLGNYVNANCKALGGAVGVTLESVAKLAHTRCLGGPREGHRPVGDSSLRKGSGPCTPLGNTPRVSTPRGSTPRGSRLRGENALILLLEHLQDTRPGFIADLAVDIDGCRAARDLDPKAMQETFTSLSERIDTVKALLDSDCATCDDTGNIVGNAEALQPARLQAFIDVASPRVEALRERMTEFRQVSEDMRAWFAEAPSTGFADMMRSLAILRETLPASKLQTAPPYPPRPQPCFLRHVAKRLVQRASSAPPPRSLVGGSCVSRSRCSSAPPKTRQEALEGNAPSQTSLMSQKMLPPASQPKAWLTARPKDVGVQPVLPERPIRCHRPMAQI